VSVGPSNPRRRVWGEAVVFALGFGLAYAALAVLFFERTPLLFEHLDQLFDADFGLWTIDMARPQGPHTPTSVHPLFMLFFKPFGLSLRALLRMAGVPLAARLAAALLCAVAGGACVGAFRVLLQRLGVTPTRARPWTLVLALSTTQLLFSSLPESFAFSALSLVVVFAVAAGPGPSEAARVAAGVFSFGVTVTNLVAVALARATGLEWRRGLRRPLVGIGRHLLVVLLAAAALGVVQWLVYPAARPFFVPEVPGRAYQRSFVRSASPTVLTDRAIRVTSHLLFTGLAAPRLDVRPTDTPRIVADFGRRPLLRPRWSSAAHMLLWAVLLVLATGGIVRSTGPPRRVVWALLAWLVIQAGVHLVFGTSLFLYSGHWVFALVALAAAGLEGQTTLSLGRVRVAAYGLVALQAAANGAFLLDVVRVYGGG